MSKSSRWRTLSRPRAGVRTRSTAAAALVVALALAVGSVLLLVLLRHTLVSAIDDAATTRAGEVTTEVRSDDRSDLAEYLADTNRSTHLVQVVDDKGALVASSSRRAHQVPASSLRPGDGQVVRQQVGSLPALNEDDPYFILVRGVTHQGHSYTVIIAAPLHSEQETITTVQKYLLAGFPLLLLLVGVATWVLVGRALRPVEQIRAHVRGISAAQLDERVPVPATNDEIARLAVTMNEMLDRLQSAQDSQRRFVADASHELRSPLATMTVGLEVAGAHLTDNWPELHAMMQTEAARMRRLVEDLLLLAKADDTGLALVSGDVDLDDLVDAEARRLQMSTPLQVHADIAPVRVRGDAARLGQVIRNLVDNATREASQQVSLSLHEQQQSAVIIVEDDGQGIPVSDRDRVFERFVRLDESRERGRGGSGLGLAIVAEVVRGHGGTVQVGESALGGACFEVRLPVRAPEEVPMPRRDRTS